MDACRTCDAPILWARTEKGKNMPVDPEPVADGNIRLETVAGALPRAIVDPEPDLLGTPRYKSHFATCPQGPAWRAPKQRHSPTSTEAAEKIEPVIGVLHRRLIGLLKRAGPCTDEELAAGLQMNPSTARPRRIELVRAGLIEQVGTATTRSGRSAARWYLTEKGRR